MIVILVLPQFLPLILGWLTKKYVPNIKKIINKFSTTLSFILMTLINLVMFARFSDYFFRDLSFVLTNILLASFIHNIWDNWILCINNHE